MYSLTEVTLTDPELQQLFARLATAVAMFQVEEEQQQPATESEAIVAVIAWHNEQAVGCGLLKRENSEKAELRRLYSSQPGVGSAILHYLEQQARQQGFQSVLVAARIINSRAVNFFLHKGFKKCALYGKYRYSSQAICLEKQL